MEKLKYCPVCGQITSARRCIYCKSSTPLIESEHDESFYYTEEYRYKKQGIKSITAKTLILEEAKRNPLFNQEIADAAAKRSEELLTHNKTAWEAAYDKDHPRCPKCGSTAITTGARGVNFIFGFIGASKTVNRCGNCGHIWTPKK